MTDDHMVAIRTMAMEESYLTILALYRQLQGLNYYGGRYTKAERVIYNGLVAEIRAAVEARRAVVGDEMVTVAGVEG